MCLLWEGTNKRKTKGAIDFCVTVKEEKKNPKSFLLYLREVCHIVFQ